ncbi:pilus assembly protein TadG-related protein [Streptomyces sp. OfavH-34-F]|uniref:pilus assembly protein TadG-related protein n=1 Tax=Streptomyces sp. OfavH-34-F TaxID=2917760 RepID=UPI001EF32C87|nr:pilus assembly protein TadG-related protein [Streptomyces sp. OfavH-34-F]MCG7526540.1 pilus assembly protein TadG-related protein [Streptomyces sp. OfavH-34-F]
MSPRIGDSGQAMPLYVVAVTGLLFIALIFFAFGEADVQRNGAQSAADAAALAAAKEARSALEPDLKAHLTDSGYLESVFSTSFPGGPGDTCWKASAFAALNKATAVRCRSLSDGRWGYEVSLQSAKGISTGIVPGTEGKKATAEAVAVVEPRCTFTAEAEPEPEPTPEPDSTPDPEATPDPVPDTPPASIGTVSCDGGRDWAIDPEDLTGMPDMADLFSVHLAEN